MEPNFIPNQLKPLFSGLDQTAKEEVNKWAKAHIISSPQPQGSDPARLNALREFLLDKSLFQPVVSVEVFFDGNADPTSIGRNLGGRHPGIPLFRQILLDLVQLPYVEGAYALIDKARGRAWPFTDMIFVAGQIPLDELKQRAAPLHPGEVSTEFSVPAAIEAKHQCPITGVWWD